MRISDDDIKTIEVFSGISSSTIEDIKKSADIIHLKKNRALYSDRQVIDYVYFLLSGNISLIKSNENGESRVIFLLSSGSMINQPLMRKNTSGLECWGFEDSKIIRITFDKFDQLMSKDYTLARNCMLFMERRIRRLYRQLKNSVTLSIEKRLSAKLYRLALEHGIKDNSFENYTLINLNISVTYIAKMLGYQRETVSRAIKILMKNEILKMEERKFYVNMKLANQFFKK